MQTNKEIQKINIEKVFRDKNPKLAGMLPKFVFNYLRRIIHEDFLNQILEKHGHKQGVSFATAVIDEFSMHIEVKGRENIPAEGRYIVACNHPLGAFDGMIMIILLNRFGYDFKVLVNDILMNISNLTEYFVPINKHGALQRDIAKTMGHLFNSDMQLVTFPSGLVSRRQKGVVMDLPWQKNFIVKAKAYKRDVIPVHFSGRNSAFFYNLHSIRKFLGIKANIEMFYLVDETYKHRNSTITVTFGKPVSYEVFDNRFKADVWANKVKDYVYELAKNEEADFIVAGQEI